MSRKRDKMTGTLCPKNKAAAEGGLPQSKCPTCGYEMDSATGTTHDEDPRPGDLTVCLNCGEMLQFNDIMVAKSLPVGLLDQLPSETREELFRAVNLIRKRGPIH